MKENINIQWFPGHMTKAKRMMEENVKYVDAVCEVIDARIPVSSRNPDLDEICGSKPRLIIMNRVDQADDTATRQWVDYFQNKGFQVLKTDSKSGKGTNALASAVKSLLKDKLLSFTEKGMVGRNLRIMVVGIPNVGKSSFINRVAGRKAAQTSDRPGVTRGKQWISLNNGLELLDTPGILWPKFESRTVGENLAFTGAVKDDILDREALAGNLLLLLAEKYPERLKQRYKIVLDNITNGYDLLERAARKRGFIISGGEADMERMSAVLLDEFRSGKLGKITLEVPSDETTETG